MSMGTMFARAIEGRVLVFIKIVTFVIPPLAKKKLGLRSNGT